MQNDSKSIGLPSLRLRKKYDSGGGARLGRSSSVRMYILHQEITLGPSNLRIDKRSRSPCIPFPDERWV